MKGKLTKLLNIKVSLIDKKGELICLEKGFGFDPDFLKDKTDAVLDLFFEQTREVFRKYLKGVMERSKSGE